LIFDVADERAGVDFADAVLEAPMGMCFFGLTSAERKCAGSGHTEMEKPRAASV
jgi:hypothetical protein